MEGRGRSFNCLLHRYVGGGSSRALPTSDQLHLQRLIALLLNLYSTTSINQFPNNLKTLVSRLHKYLECRYAWARVTNDTFCDQVSRMTIDLPKKYVKSQLAPDNRISGFPESRPKLLIGELPSFHNGQ